MLWLLFPIQQGRRVLVLTLRTDKPEAEIGLFEDETKLDYEVWTAHRALAETIHAKIKEVLDRQNKDLKDIEAVVCYKGPGSFTGLRIGLSVANALASGLNIPIAGIEGEEGWLEKGLARIGAGENDKMVVPAYGAPVHITEAKK